jgi:hypothetical protein
MEASRIQSLIAADAALQALQAAGDYGAIAESINGMGLTRVVDVNGGIGTVMKAIGPEAGGQLLDQLEGLAATNSAVKWALVLVGRGDLNFGDPATRAMIDALTPAPVAAALKAVAEVPDVTTHLEVMTALGA